jgi:hypothetical protein
MGWQQSGNNAGIDPFQGTATAGNRQATRRQQWQRCRLQPMATRQQRTYRYALLLPLPAPAAVVVVKTGKDYEDEIQNPDTIGR